MNIFKTMKTAVIAAVLGVVMAGAAAAMPTSGISGEVRFSGNVFDRTDTAGVTFDGTTALVIKSKGDFESYLSVGDPVTVSSFLFSDLLDGPLAVWSGGGFDFAITAIKTAASLNDSGGISFVALGLLTHPDFLATTGIFTFSSDGSDENGEGIFSATTSVPVPAAALLLGTGLIGMGVVARRRKKTAAA